MISNNDALIACDECDLLQRETQLPEHGEAECARCGAKLYRDKPQGLDNALAFLLAAAVVFVFANAFPLMELDARGLSSDATLFDTAYELHEFGMTSVALLMFATTILFPALVLGAFLYLLLPLRLGHVPRGVGHVFRFIHTIRPWAMVEVFMLGALVSLVKLTQIATVYPGIALFAVGAFIMLFAAGESSFEPREMWRRVAQIEGR